MVLASCSDYFRAMLTPPNIITEDSNPDGQLPMLEQRRSQPLEVFLAGVSAAGVKYLLDFIYTSKLALSLANIQDVLSAASYLQVLQVVEACSNYLQVKTLKHFCRTFLPELRTYFFDERSDRKGVYVRNKNCLSL